MDIQSKGMLLLIKSALADKPFALPEGFDFANAVKASHKHQIQVMIYLGALNCGISNKSSEMEDLKLYFYSLMLKNQKQLSKLDIVINEFEKNNIDYMLLKGTVLKKLYPFPEMRSMSDADVLIRQEEYFDKIKPVMLDLGFSDSGESDHEFMWKSPDLYLELHKRIIPSYNKDFYEYFGDGWRLADSNENCRYFMKKEDEYIYIFTHLAKHFRDGGIGIKNFTDLWIYRTKYTDLNFDYILEELEKLSLREFYTNIEHTLDVWFDNKEPDEISDYITSYVFESGAYGSLKNREIASRVKDMQVSGGNAKNSINKHILNKIFPSYQVMSKNYRTLNKAPYLLPIFWIIRLLQLILFKRDNIKNASKRINLLNSDDINNFDEILNTLGLTFNFKE